MAAPSGSVTVSDGTRTCQATLLGSGGTATGAYGSQTTVVLTATVSPQFAGTPTGQVTTTSAGVTLCTVTLSGGTGSCSPSSGTVLAVGTHTVTARYAGDTSFKASSAAQKLKVTAG